MSYVNKYRIPLLNPGIAGTDGAYFSVIIQERDFSGAETTLKGSNAAGILRYLNMGETKYPPIQASEVSMGFFSESNFNLEDIITDDDFQYRVVISSGDYLRDEEHFLWYGFLVTDDCFEQMQDDPKEITLKATDGLALLKTNPLYDIDVYEKKTLLEIIERCLSFTGLELDLLIEVNIYDESMNDRTILDVAHPFDQCKVHTRSFLKDQNTYNNAFDVLSSILEAFQATIFQQNGRWQIQRKHDRYAQEMLSGTLLTYPYTTSTPVYHGVDYTLPIDNIVRYPIDANHTKGFVSGVQKSTITYNYEIPEQLPRNANFNQGDFYAPLSGIDHTATRIDYWTYQKGSNTTPGTPSMTPYRKNVFDEETGRNLESYIVLPSDEPTLYEEKRLVSEAVDVSAGDVVVYSGEVKMKYHTSGDTPMQGAKIVLRAYSGAVYTLSVGTGVASGDFLRAVWLDNIEALIIFYPGTLDLTDWQTFTIRTPQFPEDGTVEFWMYDMALEVTGNETHYRNVTFDWFIYVNNVTQISGETDTIINSGVRKAVNTQEIKIGDSPRAIISGTLFRLDGTTLTANWHREMKNEVEKLIRINDIALFQSSYRLFTKIDGSFLGISYVNTHTLLIGPANLFHFTASQLFNKYYLSTNLEINLATNTFTASLQEFYDTTKDNDDPQGISQAFAYIYE